MPVEPARFTVRFSLGVPDDDPALISHMERPCVELVRITALLHAQLCAEGVTSVDDVVAGLDAVLG